jgi:glyoxylase-like metal-dependent hydrolase (beta-lactamase superfamily II)
VSDLVRVQLGRNTYACEQRRKGLGYSNSGLIAADGGLIIDTLYDLTLTRSMAHLYAEVHSETPQRIVNTHHNGDHCWGNAFFPDAEIIAHAGCAARFNDFTPAAAESIRTTPDPPPRLRSLHEDLQGFDFSDVELRPPTTVIHGDLILDLGGVRVDILYVGPAHTAGDLVVHVPDEGVVFTGDILFAQCAPIGWEGTTQRWIDALIVIESLRPELVVPGHGPITDVNGVRAMRAYFEQVRRHAEACWRDGESVLDCCSTIDLSAYATWDEPWRVAATVHRVYRECTGIAWDAKVDSASVMRDVDTLRTATSTSRPAGPAPQTH